MKFMLLWILGLLIATSTSCSEHKPAKEPAPKASKKTETEAPRTAKQKKKIKRPDPAKAAKKADDASVAELEIVKGSIAMYDNMYAIFGIMYDNMDNCDLALEKVRAYANEHRSDMLKAQDRMEAENKTMSDKDKKRYSDWRQIRDMQMVNDSMKLMIEYNYRCKEQMIEINSQIASLSTK